MVLTGRSYSKLSFLIRLEKERVWFRNEFRLLGSNKIEDFVVQLEIVEDERHLTPVRYDMKHNYFHRDIINEHENNVDKQKISVTSLEEAVNLSIDDLIQNWRSNLKIGGYDKLLSTLESFPENTMQKAKEYLIDLIRHPQKIDSVGNVINLVLSEGIGMSDSVQVKLVEKK